LDRHEAKQTYGRDEVRVDAAGSVRQDEIERLHSPAIINHDSYHFIIITAVDVVFDERLRRLSFVK
jgi:ABC-type bacteriocin/lantibiotic exporter with double-glycine peptidase domain